MPIIKSAKKRVKTAEKAAVRNARTKRNMKTAIKDLQAAIAKKDSKKVTESLKLAQSTIDTAYKKNVLHKNKAARKKSALAKMVKDSGVKLVVSKPTAKKTPAKKPVATKSPTKKPAKKPASKKS